MSRDFLVVSLVQTLFNYRGIWVSMLSTEGETKCSQLDPRPGRRRRFKALLNLCQQLNLVVLRRATIPLYGVLIIGPSRCISSSNLTTPLIISLNETLRILVRVYKN